MRKLGLTTLEASATPPGITVVKGEWPGVRMAEKGGDASAGPTGVPWVDSNGWQVRLARLRDPARPVWVATELPKAGRILPSVAYRIALADAAVYGGRWVIDLDPDLRGAIAGGPAREAWNQLMSAQRFFAAHRAWDAYRARAIVGILSDFAGPNEFTSGELLNLTARLHQPYRILLGQSAWPTRELKAIVYADAEPPKPEAKRKLIEFVQAGGLLIAGARCGITEGTPAQHDLHPRYTIRTLGRRGRPDPAQPSLRRGALLERRRAGLLPHRSSLRQGRAAANCELRRPSRSRPGLGARGRALPRGARPASG